MSATVRTRLWMVAGVVALAAAAVALGPRVDVEDRWVEPALSADLDAYLEQQEAEVADLRPGDAKGIAWREPETPRVTPLALVYLHGFSADRHEVEPLVSELGRDLGANVYFTRLAGHGRAEVAMGEATVEAWLDDAAEAVAIGGRIGERVVLMGTSTGGTLALWAAARRKHAAAWPRWSSSHRTSGCRTRLRSCCCGPGAGRWHG